MLVDIQRYHSSAHNGGEVPFRCAYGAPLHNPNSRISIISYDDLQVHRVGNRTGRVAAFNDVILCFQS